MTVFYHFRRAWARILQQKNRIVEVCHLINWLNNWFIPRILKLVTTWVLLLLHWAIIQV